MFRDTLSQAAQRRLPSSRALVQRALVLTGLAGALALSLVALDAQHAQPIQAALQIGESGRQVLIGRDDDNPNNPTIQPPGVQANQSLNNTDVQLGGSGSDILIGLLGNDVQQGDSGSDILIGGTEQFVAPNSDVQFGESGDDISIWAPGDGSDAFVGGSGRDAQILGVIDRDPNNVPTLSGSAPGFPQGVPTANLSGSPGFCRLERVASPEFGFEYLVRFFVRQTGALAVTIRLAGVEQVFCTSEQGGQITYADLTQRDPTFVVVGPEEVRNLNPLAAHIIR